MTRFGLTAKKGKRQLLMLITTFPPLLCCEWFLVPQNGRVLVVGEIGPRFVLARRGVQAVLQSEERNFPYNIRIVSEITESNGSSSMASCLWRRSRLARWMQVFPQLKPQLLVSHGPIKKTNGFACIDWTSCGDENHLGDRIFKVAGTEEGITSTSKWTLK